MLRWGLVASIASACGSTEHRQTSMSPGGAASVGGNGSAGTAIGGAPSAGTAPTAQAGTLSKAGSTTGGAAAAGSPAASAGTTSAGEGGAAGAALGGEGGAAGLSDGGAGAPGQCAPGCTKQNFGNYCTENEAEWVCQNGADTEPYATHCRNLPTGAVRYCCPSAYMANCL